MKENTIKTVLLRYIIFQNGQFSTKFGLFRTIAFKFIDKTQDVNQKFLQADPNSQTHRNLLICFSLREPVFFHTFININHPFLNF